MNQPDQADPPLDPTGLSLPVRAVLIVVGSLSLALGVIGIFLPVLPTTPFLLVTAACYARASTRLYEWLLGQPSMGPIIREWRRSRSLPPGVKTRAFVVVAITFTISLVLIDSLLARAALVTAGAILFAFLYRIPTAQAQAASVTMGLSANREEPR